MKTVVLAGGFGTRLAEETAVRPKPMVEVGGKPILWHILNIYASFQYNEFVIALGYKGEVIKEYFLNYYALNSSLSLDIRRGTTAVHDGQRPDWKVHLVDTGLNTQTGGRIRRARPWIGNETFMMTYGDAVADLNIQELVAFHRRHGRLATVTAVRPPARFGGLVIEADHVISFEEKPQSGEGWINGGFFVLEPGIFEYLSGDDSVWERAPVERLAADGQLMAFRHTGFWQPMDTLRDQRLLESLWASGSPPWCPAS